MVYHLQQRSTNHEQRDIKRYVYKRRIDAAKDSLKVTTGNTVLEESTDYQIVEHANGFDIQFTKEIKTEHTITYTTSFDYEKRADKDQKNLRNHVKLEWVNEDGKDLTKENQSVFTPTYTQSNGFQEWNI
ncbi:hypothetical protein ACEQPO_06240 [Bacillus sp. SL00103]